MLNLHNSMISNEHIMIKSYYIILLNSTCSIRGPQNRIQHVIIDWTQYNITLKHILLGCHVSASIFLYPWGDCVCMCVCVCFFEKCNSISWQLQPLVSLLYLDSPAHVKGIIAFQRRPPFGEPFTKLCMIFCKSVTLKTQKNKKHLHNFTMRGNCCMCAYASSIHVNNTTCLLHAYD